MVDSIFKAYRTAYSGLSKEVWILSFALFINRCGMMVLPFLTLYLHEERGFSEGDAAMTLSAYGLGSICGVFTGGRLTDRFGALRLFVVMLSLSIPMYLVVPLTQTVPQLLVAIFFLSFFAEGLRPANNAAIAEYSSKEKLTRSFGLQRMAVNLGVSFGPAVGGFLAEVNFSWLFIGDAVTTFACVFFVVSKLGFKRGSVESESVAEEQRGKLAGMKHRSVLADPVFMVFLGILLLTSIAFFQFQTTYPLYLTDHYQLSKRTIGLICAVNTITIVVFEMLLLEKAKQWSMLRSIGWGCGLACLGFGMLPFSSALWFAIVAMVIVTVGEMLWMPLSTGWVGQRCTPQNRGSMMGYYAMNYSLASVVSPIVFGNLYDYDHHLVWYITLGIGFIAWIGFYMLANATEHDDTE